MTAIVAAEPRMVRVAAIQAEPAWNDLEGGVNKSIALIEEAAAGGANVLGFPEVFIPGYPWYMGQFIEYDRCTNLCSKEHLGKFCA